MFIVYECRSCYALIPYIGCHHNCAAAEEDEGFEEVPHFLRDFIRILAYCRRHHLRVVVVEAPVQPLPTVAAVAAQIEGRAQQ